MRILAVAVLAMISVGCKTTGQYQMRAAAFVVPTFEEDAEDEAGAGEDSAFLDAACGDKNSKAEECVERTKSLKTSLNTQAAR